MNIKLRFSNISYIIGYFISIVIIGLVSWLQVNFSLEHFNAYFFYNMGMTTLAYLIAIISTIEWKSKTTEENNEEINKCKSYVRVAFDKYIVDGKFNEYLYQVNKQKKIKVWRKHITEKLKALNQKVSYKNMLVWNSQDEDKKSKNRYCKLRTRYELQLTDEFCNKYIDGIKWLGFMKPLRYEHITLATINGSANTNYDGDRDFTIKGEQQFKDIAPKFLLNFAFVIFVASFASPEFYNFTPEMLINTLTKLAGMIGQIANGLSYGKEYTEIYVLKDWQKRKGYIENYLIQNNITTPK